MQEQYDELGEKRVLVKVQSSGLVRLVQPQWELGPACKVSSWSVLQARPARFYALWAVERAHSERATDEPHTVLGSA